MSLRQMLACCCAVLMICGCAPNESPWFSEQTSERGIDFVHHSGCARLAALSTRWLGDDAIWHPHAGADRTVTQEQVAVNPGDTPVDDSVFPCVWQDS